MENNKQIYKQNSIYIILIGIAGFCFGMLNWDRVWVDIIYLKYDNKLLISIITANIATAKFIANIFCVKLNDAKNPNKIFKTCIIIASILVILIAISYKQDIIALFAICYLLETMVLEIYSGYHYAYAYNSLPSTIAIKVHSKRIALFKIMQAIGVIVAGYIISKFINNAVISISLLTIFVFIIIFNFVKKVKNFPKNIKKEKERLLSKINIKKYSTFFKKIFAIKIIESGVISSLVVILSIKAIDDKMNLELLTVTKSLDLILSGIGFSCAAYFIKKNIIIEGSILTKIIMSVLIFLTLIIPEMIFVIVVFRGVLNPFNTMSNFKMLKLDNDEYSIAQKELVINLYVYISTMITSYIFLNINVNIYICIAGTLLFLSSYMMYKIYKEKQQNIF